MISLRRRNQTSWKKIIPLYPPKRSCTVWFVNTAARNKEEGEKPLPNLPSTQRGSPPLEGEKSAPTGTRHAESERENERRGMDGWMERELVRVRVRGVNYISVCWHVAQPFLPVYMYEQGRGGEGRRSLKLWWSEWKDEGEGRGGEKMRKKRKDEEKARDQWEVWRSIGTLPVLPTLPSY